MSDLSRINFFIGSEKVLTQQPFSAFSDRLLMELNLLSQFLLEQAKDESIIAALGFWLRSANLRKIAYEYNEQARIGRGLAFHIAPGNVDTLFFYSIITSLLAGNPTILKLSSKQSDICRLLLHYFQTAIDTLNLSKIKHNVAVIGYSDADKMGAESLTHILSLSADLRVVWGSDNTVEYIDKIPQKIAGKTVCFPHRYSVALLSLNDDNVAIAAELFKQDVKAFYQQACSSAKVVYWLNTTEAVKDKFWRYVNDKLTNELPRVPFSTSEQIDRLAFVQHLVFLEDNINAIDTYPLVTRILCQHVSRESIDLHPGLFQFIEQDIERVNQLKLFEHCQTLTSFGIDVAELIPISETFKRQVNLGQALQYNHHWDGIDQIKAYSRAAATLLPE